MPIILITVTAQVRVKDLEPVTIGGVICDVSAALTSANSEYAAEIVTIDNVKIIK